MNVCRLHFVGGHGLAEAIRVFPMIDLGNPIFTPRMSIRHWGRVSRDRAQCTLP